MKIKLKKSPYGLYPVDQEGEDYLNSLALNDTIEVDVQTEKSYTEKQRGALHVWCKMLADELNNAGLDMRKVLKEDADIPWAGITVKEYIYKPVLNAMTMKSSTEEQSTVEPSRVVDVIVRHFANNPATTGITVPWWPSKARIDTTNQGEQTE